MRTFQYISVFLTSLLLFTGSIQAQDLLYRKNAVVLSVRVTAIEPGSVSYTIPSDSKDKMYLISTEALDSIISAEGKKIWQSDFGSKPRQKIKRNYFGIDLLESFIAWEADFEIAPNNLHLYYEHIASSGRTSFSLEYLTCLKQNNDLYVWDGNWFFYDGWHFSYSSYIYFIKAGINYYPFNYSLAKTSRLRTFTGASLYFGQIWKSDWDDPYNERDKTSIGGLIWNIDTRYYLCDYFQLKAGLDITIIPFLVFISPELGFSISF